MIDRHGDGAERDAVEPVGQKEDARLHVRQREIGGQHLLVERIVFLAQFLGVVPPVPRSERLPGIVGLEQGLHFGQFLPGLFQRRGPYLVEQSVDRRRGPGHLPVGHIGRIGGIAQQVRLFGPQADEVVDKLVVVVFIAVAAAVQIGFVGLFAQVAALRVGQQRNQAGFVEREDVLAAAAQFLRLVARQLAGVVRNPFEVFGREFKHELVVLGQQVGAELHRHEGQFFVDGLEPRFLFLAEQRARADERAVGLFQQAGFVGSQPEFARRS